MTKDEIIAIAVEAGLIRVGDGWTEPHRWGISELEAFANLVEAAARNLTFTQAHWTDYERSIVAAEREACAKVCDTHYIDDVLEGVGIAQSCAAAIRARGNT